MAWCLPTIRVCPTSAALSAHGSSSRCLCAHDWGTGQTALAPKARGSMAPTRSQRYSRNTGRSTSKRHLWSRPILPVSLRSSPTRRVAPSSRSAETAMRFPLACGSGSRCGMRSVEPRAAARLPGGAVSTIPRTGSTGAGHPSPLIDQGERLLLDQAFPATVSRSTSGLVRHRGRPRGAPPRHDGSLPQQRCDHHENWNRSDSRDEHRVPGDDLPAAITLGVVVHVLGSR